MKLTTRLGAVAGLFCLLGSIYALLIRPAQLRWGATDAEVRRPMPEDGIVARPAFDATRAITIRGRPEDIWPWLAQMGYGRAGFYGYDLIENAGGGTGIRSADRILPALQNPQTGDVLPLSVAASLCYGAIAPGRYMVWRARDTPPSGVFIWQLVPIDAQHTRLISRIRWRYVDGAWGFALGVFTEFADHVAVRAILRGIRDRVERRTPQSLVAQGVEISAWLLTTLAFLAAVVLTLSARRWPAAWWIALAAGLFLQFEFYASPPIATSVASSLLLIGLVVWCARSRLWSSKLPLEVTG